VSAALKDLPVTSPSHIDAIAGTVLSLTESPENLNRATQVNKLKTFQY